METAPIPLQKGEDFAESIAAIATPSGNGGVGIIRISGSRLLSLAAHIVKKELPPRNAIYSTFVDADGHVIDCGIALYFPAPHS
jgi:tRNA modification GTPase